MRRSSRYLYRYIIFCIANALIVISFVISLFFFQQDEDAALFNISVSVLYLFATTWRILEITVFNNYFNSLKNDPDCEHYESYTPLN